MPMTILAKSKSNSWSAKMRLYYSLVESTMSYGVSIWGLTYHNTLETSQLDFFRINHNLIFNFLALPQSTTHSVVRSEVGVDKMEYKVTQSAIEWVLKILRTNE